jgi:quercetin dioxygenase-like cupin family protein
MPRFIDSPTVIPAEGNKPKVIREYIGNVNTGHNQSSLAHMISPGGWVEPGQRPDFQELTLVLKGQLHVDYEGGQYTVNAGQAIITEPGEWVRYSTPGDEGAEYIAVCLPAFSPASVHRDE